MEVGFDHMIKKIMVANKETVILKSDESYIGFPATVEEVKTLSYYEEYREYIKRSCMIYRGDKCVKSIYLFCYVLQYLLYRKSIGGYIHDNCITWTKL